MHLLMNLLHEEAQLSHTGIVSACSHTGILSVYSHTCILATYSHTDILSMCSHTFYTITHLSSLLYLILLYSILITIKFLLLCNYNSLIIICIPLCMIFNKINKIFYMNIYFRSTMSEGK